MGTTEKLKLGCSAALVAPGLVLPGPFCRASDTQQAAVFPLNQWGQDSFLFSCELRFLWLQDPRSRSWENTRGHKRTVTPVAVKRARNWAFCIAASRNVLQLSLQARLSSSSRWLSWVLNRTRADKDTLILPHSRTSPWLGTRAAASDASPGPALRRAATGGAAPAGLAARGCWQLPAFFSPSRPSCERTQLGGRPRAAPCPASCGACFSPSAGRFAQTCAGFQGPMSGLEIKPLPSFLPSGIIFAANTPSCAIYYAIIKTQLADNLGRNTLPARQRCLCCELAQEPSGSRHGQPPRSPLPPDELSLQDENWPFVFHRSINLHWKTFQPFPSLTAVSPHRHRRQWHLLPHVQRPSAASRREIWVSHTMCVISLLPALVFSSVSESFHRRCFQANKMHALFQTGNFASLHCCA
nr:uncharacterized protein LOC112989387 [Dromaius novaehollandiae]